MPDGEAMVNVSRFSSLFYFLSCSDLGLCKGLSSGLKDLED